MKFDLQPQNTTNEYKVPYCAVRSNTLQYNIPYKLIVSDWKIWNKKRNYSLQIELANNFIIHDDKISCSTNNFEIKGNKEFDFNIDVTVDSDKFTELNDGDRVLINYQLKLIQGNSSVITFNEEIVFIKDQANCCSVCKQYYKEQFCQIQLNDEILYYSDKNRGQNNVHITNLEFNTPNERNISKPERILLDYTVKDGEVTLNSNRIEWNGENNIPLTLDMTSLEYPEEEKNLTLNVSCQYQCNDETHNSNYTLSLPFKPDPCYNKLDVYVRDGECESKIYSQREVHKLSDIHLLKAIGHNGGEIIRKDIVIKNLASKIINAGVDNGVRIRNLRTEVVSDLSRIEGNWEALKKGWTYEFLEERILSPNGNPELTIPLNFNLAQIGNIQIQDHSRTMEWILKISFDYKEERLEYHEDNMIGVVVGVSPNNQWRSFEATLVTSIHRTDPVCFYSVDLGTSAVVAYKMGKDVNGFSSPVLIDLKTIKNNLLVKEYPSDKDKRDDKSESASHLIASTIYWNKASKSSTDSSTDQFKDRALWFSPSSGMTTPDCLFPCLKCMMGQSQIPQIPNLKNDIGRNVSWLVESVYEQLSTFYLSKPDFPIESLILTVPNSFTPIHLEQIRSSVMKNIHSLADELFYFISESDSVLCSYICDSDTNTNSELSNIRQHDQGEHILVFDMGAGTLDITYARYKRNDANNVLEIIAKRGINRAGNYIDYLLGEIIIDLLKENIDKENLRKLLSIVPSNIDDYLDKKNLKEYLRNKVKILLTEKNSKHDLPIPYPENKGSEYRLLSNRPELKGLKNIKIGDILQHEKYVSYIQSCTENLINNLRNSHGENMGLGQKKLRVDTVIFSGRTSSLEAIRKSVKRSIETNTPRRTNINYYEISNQEGVTPKTVVAKGALDYLRLKRDNTFQIIKKTIYGSYGLLLKQTNNQSLPQWIPLICENDVMKDDSICKEESISLGGVSDILLIHSYSSTPGNDENKTILHRISVPDAWNNSSKKIKLSMDKKNQIQYCISDADGTNPIPYRLEPHDDYYDESLRKSLWPVVYN